MLESLGHWRLQDAPQVSACACMQQQHLCYSYALVLQTHMATTTCCDASSGEVSGWESMSRRLSRHGRVMTKTSIIVNVLL